MKITYLYHSGFMVDTGKHVLIFDYWKDTPKGGTLSDGVIDPNQIADRDVIVFASHIHGDHYFEGIFKWRESIKKIRYILSDDIPKKKDAVMLGANQDYSGGDFTVKTFLSNDEGIAFLVEIDGKRIYHAGDLNWWHWEGEPGSWNDDIRESYQKEIGLLGKEPIDLAFVPVDPRLEEQYAWGIDYLMKTAIIRHAVPMHFGDDSGVVGRLLSDPVSAAYRDRIVPMTERGQTVEIS